MLREALAGGLDSAEVRAGLAYTYARRGDLDHALAEWRAASERDPADPEHRYNIARVHQSSRRAKEAMAEYRRAIALDGKHDQALTNLGIMLRQTGDLTGASERLERAVQANPDNRRAMSNLAELLRDLTRHDQAVAMFRRLLGGQDNDPWISAMLGHTLLELGRFEEALGPLQTARQFRDRTGGRGMYANLWLSQCERSLAAVAEFPALESASELSAEPKRALELATVAQRAGRASLAVRLYQHAFDAAPDIVGFPIKEHLFRAACAAAVAAEDDGGLRAIALRWLQQALDDWRKPAVLAATLAPTVSLRLRRWREARWLAPLRDPEMLAALPAEERAAWTIFWHDVERFEREQLSR